MFYQRIKKLNRKVMALVVLFGIFYVDLAKAADPLPGSACSVNNSRIRSGGPETSGVVYDMTCQGGVWVATMTLAANSNVGIGLTNPAWPLHVHKTSTETAVNNRAAYISYQVAPGSAQTAGIGNGSLFGYTWIPNGMANVETVSGLNGQADNVGNTTIAKMIGTQGYASNTSTGTVTNMMGVWGGTETFGGTITHMTGVSAQPTNQGATVTNMNGVSITMGNNSGTITNRKALNINTPGGSATNDWGIYQDGGGLTNYFAADVGIGTTTVNAMIDVVSVDSYSALDLRADDSTPDTWEGAAWQYSYLSGSSGTYSGFGGIIAQVVNARTGAGFNEARAINSEAQATNDAAVQNVTGVYATATTHASDVGYAIQVADGSSTGGTMYGIYINLDDPDPTRFGIYQQSTNNNYFAGNVGIGTTSPAANLDNAGSTALSGDLSPAQITANQNDYNPASLATSTVLRLSSDASRDITGLAGGYDGRLLTIINVGSNAIVLKNESGSSSAANRFTLNSDQTLSANQAAVLIYDTTASRWRSVSAPGGSASTVSDNQVFTSSGTWNKPAGTNANQTVIVEVWAGGGGGSSGGSGGGGGGGAYFKLVTRAGDLSSSVSVTVGGGGTVASDGTAGGTSSFGSYISVYGGGGGNSSGFGGGGGGTYSVGVTGLAPNGGAPDGGDSTYGDSSYGGGSGGPIGGGGRSVYGGGGGGRSGTNGGTSMYGGGGGGGASGGLGGTSNFGGAGGNNGVAGTAPGGGGGRNAAGARGEVRVTVVP